MFEPGLEVPGAGFDDGARSEAVRREPRERGLVEIVKRGDPPVNNGDAPGLLLPARVGQPVVEGGPLP